MRRREFIGAVPLLLAGCGSGEGEMEFDLHPSPRRQTGALNTTVPGYLEYKTARTSRVDASAAANVTARFRLVKVGAAVTMAWDYETAITGAGASGYVTLGPLIPEPFWPIFDYVQGLVGVEDNGGPVLDPGFIRVSKTGEVTVNKNAVGNSWTTLAGMAVYTGSLSWTTIA